MSYTISVLLAIFARKNNDERGTMIINQAYAYGFCACLMLLIITEVLAFIYSLPSQTILNLIILIIALSSLLVSISVFAIHKKLHKSKTFVFDTNPLNYKLRGFSWIFQYLNLCYNQCVIIIKKHEFLDSVRRLYLHR